MNKLSQRLIKQCLIIHSLVKQYLINQRRITSRMKFFLPLFFLLPLFNVQAGVITSLTWYSGIASVALEPIPTLVTPGNDDVAGDSPNSVIVYQKDYTAIGPVDIVFTVDELLDPIGAVTEYIIIEGVQNGTGLDWSAYHMELGFGVGAGFVKSTSGDGLDFDAPTFNSTFDFSPGGFFFDDVLVTEDDVYADNGSHLDGAYAGNYIIHIDVPDGITEFTLRQSPIAAPVPIPAAGGLFLAAMFGMGLFKKLRD